MPNSAAASQLIMLVVAERSSSPVNGGLSAKDTGRTIAPPASQNDNKNKSDLTSGKTLNSYPTHIKQDWHQWCIDIAVYVSELVHESTGDLNISFEDSGHLETDFTGSMYYIVSVIQYSLMRGEVFVYYK